MEKMLKFQKRAARIILNKSYDTPSKTLFKQLGWLTFQQRITYHKGVLTPYIISTPDIGTNQASMIDFDLTR